MKKIDEVLRELGALWDFEKEIRKFRIRTKRKRSNRYGGSRKTQR